MTEADQQVRRPESEQLKQRARECSALELMSKEQTLRLRRLHVGPSALFFPQDPLKIVRGSGAFLYDELGCGYLDCINNVAHVGHGNPRVQAAVSEQLGLLNTNTRFLHDNLSNYARRLTSLFPKRLSVCYLVNSGSEANDLAIRMARAATGRKDIASLEGAYHGNLTSTMAISPYKTDKLAGKRAKWAHVAPLPCEYRGRFQRDHYPNLPAGSDTIGRLYAAAAVEVLEAAKARGRQLAGFFVESMVSCGGQLPLPTGYLRHLQRYLRSEGALLICDEVQTGFGRSGERMWAFQLDGDDIEPDIVTLGKPMGNGFPVAGVLTTVEVAAAFGNIGTEYFNTFGGNAASCAAAGAVLDELEERRLVSNARTVGSFLLDELRQIQSKSRLIGDVRGCGLFVGAELVECRATKRPAPQLAEQLVRRLRKEQILISTEGRFGNVLKFKPPLVFSMDDARRLVAALADALAELEAQLDLAETNSSSGSSSASSSSWLESSSELESAE